MPAVMLLFHVFLEKPTKDNADYVVINSTNLRVDGPQEQFAVYALAELRAQFPQLTGFTMYRGLDKGSSTEKALRDKFKKRRFDEVMVEIAGDAPYDEFFGVPSTGGLPPRVAYIAVAQTPMALALQARAPAPAAAAAAADETRDELEILKTSALSLPTQIRLSDFEARTKKARDRKSPSVAAKSSDYTAIQASDDGLLDGRSSPNGPQTWAYPVELFHPAFATYKRDAENPALDVPEACVRDVAALMRSLSAVAELETARDTVESRDILGAILACFFEKVSNANKTSADCTAIIPTPIRSINAPIVIVEIKPELGSGGSDPSTQVSFSYEQFVCAKEREALLAQSNCPSFLIGLAGPWIVICGAVMMHRTIVQRLSAYEWYACSRVGDDAGVLALARHLFALRNGIDALKKYYSELPPPTLPINKARYFPFRTSYLDENGNEVKFRYDKALEEGLCIVFLAQKLDAEGADVEGGKFVVKFVSRYNPDVHRHMAEGGFAPRLLCYEPLGAGYGDWALVAMEHVDGKTILELHGEDSLPAEVIAAVQKALDHLREEKYIMPDLRRPNVMLVDGDEPIEERVRFIDFDWACVEGGGARYPVHLSKDIRESSGAKDYEVITRKHEEVMFERVFSR